SRPTSSASRSSGPRWRRPPRSAPPTPPGSRSGSGRRSRTCGPTGARTSSGTPRWTAPWSGRSTRSGRRPSPVPSTGSSDGRAPDGGRRVGTRRPPIPRCHDDRVEARGAEAASGRSRRGHPDGPERRTEAMSATARLRTEVLVIGGGSTGLGVVRDAAMRGFSTVLVDRGDLATGTTGRFHGLLHSGGRYVVKDPKAAEECIHENWILRKIAADCIEDTGG